MTFVFRFEYPPTLFPRSAAHMSLHIICSDQRTIKRKLEPLLSVKHNFTVIYWFVEIFNGVNVTLVQTSHILLGSFTVKCFIEPVERLLCWLGGSVALWQDSWGFGFLTDCCSVLVFPLRILSYLILSHLNPNFPWNMCSQQWLLWDVGALLLLCSASVWNTWVPVSLRLMDPSLLWLASWSALLWLVYSLQLVSERSASALTPPGFVIQIMKSHIVTNEELQCFLLGGGGGLPSITRLL